MLFGTTGSDQKFHTIGYGLCSKEDTEAHRFVFAALKKEVERVVNDRAMKQLRV